jgi:hypothetical protein
MTTKLWFGSFLSGLRRGFPGAFLFPLFLLASVAGAQISGTASIQGTISDPTGAVIPSALVTVTEDATHVQHTAKTDDKGLYNFPNINIGTYTLTTVSAGFKGYKQSGIVLDVGSSIAVNVTMTIGVQDQEVEVRSAGVALQTEDAAYKQTIDQRTLTELPLNGRQITSLITLAGASVPSSALTQGNKGFFSSVSPQIAGGQGNQSDYRLDGGDNNDYESNTSFPFPFPDAVAQFTVETSAVGAQSGLHPAGVINVVTRSGSNQWHGAAFDFIRNNYINASNYFSQLKDQLHQNQFGGTLGGKVIRDKLFFFAGYQRLVSSAGTSPTSGRVPTAANLAGDFSANETFPCFNAKNGAGQQEATQLLNPLTGAALPNDKISPSFFNASALAVLKYLPQPYDACGDVSFVIPTFQTENQFVTRIDATINSKHSLYGRYFVDGYVTPALFSPTNALLTANPGNTERAQTLTLGETWIASSKLVNTFHLTATRRTNTRGPAGTGVNAATFGINVYQPLDIGFREQGAGFNLYCSTCAAGTFNVNSFSVIDDANLVIGKHQLVFGGEFIRAQLNVNNNFTDMGTFNFSSIFSQKGPAQSTPFPTGLTVNGAPTITGGQSLLDFLSGSMTSFSQSKPQQNAMRAPIPSLYVQDTYHVTKQFVLSLGVRWSAQFTPFDYFGRGSSFDMNAFIANQHSTRFPNAPAGALFYGDSGIPKNFTSNYLNQFSPRVGFTFDPFGDGKTVLRGGMSMIYDETNFFASTETTQNPPFATLVTNTATSAPISFSNPWVGGTSPGNPFPQPFTPPSSQTFSTGAQFIVYPLQFPTPYVVQWTASIQHDLGRGWQLQVDYLGNKTTHSPYGYPLNPIVYIPGNYSVAGSCGAIATAPKVGTACSTTSNSQARSQLQMINPTQGAYYLGGGGGGASTTMVAGANARYDGLVSSIQHRASKGFTFLANHTWSHCFDLLDNPGAFNTVAMENPNDKKRDYAACGFDRRHIINMALVATSHFSLKSWKGYAVNDWEIAPILRFTSGAPYSVTSGLDNSLTALSTDRPNWTGTNAYIRGVLPSPVTTSNLPTLDITQFSQNALGTYGNLARNNFVGPKTFTLDSSLSRNFPLYERLALTLRLEAFNVLNHPVFGNPGANLNSPGGFGRITSASAPRIFQLAGKFTF